MFKKEGGIDGMTLKQKAFANYYLETGNATESYKLAYPNITKQRTAESAGNRLLSNVEVKKYINERLAQIEDKRIAKIEEVLEYLTKGMRQQLEEEVVVTENIGDYMSEARVVKKKIGIKDSNKCAELLGKRYGIFTDKVEQTTDVTVNSTAKLDSILNQLGENNE